MNEYEKAHLNNKRNSVAWEVRKLSARKSSSNKSGEKNPLVKVAVAAATATAAAADMLLLKDSSPAGEAEETGFKDFMPTHADLANEQKINRSNVNGGQMLASNRRRRRKEIYYDDEDDEEDYDYFVDEEEDRDGNNDGDDEDEYDLDDLDYENYLIKVDGIKLLVSINKYDLEF